MKLDDLGRRAAAEIKEASREARFTVRAPGRRPFWARPAWALAAGVAVLAVGLPVLFVVRPWYREVVQPGTTTTSSTTTMAAGKTPAATMPDLVASVYAALKAKDSAALWALHADDAGSHFFYYAQEQSGYVSGAITPGYDLASDRYQSIEVLGEPVVSGDVVLIPVVYTYPEPDGVFTGFEVLRVNRVAGGLLVGGGATFLSDNGPDEIADPAEAWALIQDAAAAANAGDVEGVLATMSGDVLLWEDVFDPDAKYAGAVAVRQVLTDLGTYFRVEFTGEPVYSGPFVALPSRHTVEASGESVEGLYIFWIRDGKIALQAYARGD